ncbi:hypothetical protein Taro_050304 [Colocasia esculenta]|uniref:Aminotransferase-like plant mobile domain-containing protein n=1 Tax=Colocasia esculenta TaxID=4460 RepID=A0A843XDI4_COLES|nr:hypothetical protein [Colocasia esculenta]
MTVVTGSSLWSWERLHVGCPDIVMHPLAQDMPLGHKWNVLREEINNPRHILRLYRSELDHQEDYQVRWEPYISDILSILPVISKQGSNLWLSRVSLLCFSIVEMHVPDRVLR